MKRVSFHELAERELNDAALYYEQENAGLGFKFLEEVERYIGVIIKVAMEYFDRLGGLVNRLWREHWMDAEYFPEAATTAIREVPPHAHVNSRDVVAWAFATNAIPPQLDLRSEFGEPPLTVYNDGDVIIDIYFWLDGSTAIHQHAFAGAFFVLEGASVETVYEFRIGHRYNAQLLTGHLLPQQVRLNTRGTCHPIYPGQRFIHTLFHLDKPSVSIVIRINTPWALPQYEYWWPGIAIQPFRDAFPLQQRRLELLTMLGFCRPGDLLPLFRAHVAHWAPHQVLWGLNHTRRFFAGRLDDLRELLRILTSFHGPLIDEAILAFKHNTDISDIFLLRNQVTDPELRVLLGLFLNVRNRQQLLDLVVKYFPDRQPIDAILTLVRRLFEDQSLRLDTNVLPQKRGPLTLSVLQGVLEGLSVEQLQVRLAEQHVTGLEEIPTTFEQLQASLLFNVLFEPGRVAFRSGQ